MRTTKARRTTVLGTALGTALAGCALLLAPGGTSPAQAQVPSDGSARQGAEQEPPFRLWIPRRLTATPEGPGGRLWVDLGVRAVAGAHPVELRSHRAGWKEPLTGTWNAGPLGGTLPPGLQRDFSGLSNFLKVEYRDRRGKVVKTRRVDVCLNNGGERARPDAPATSPYPFGCPMNPFTVGSVQGIQAGWATPLAWDFRPLRLSPGRYDVRVQVNPRWADTFGLASADRSLSTRLTVTQSDGHTHRHGEGTRGTLPGGGDVLGGPAAAAPTSESAGRADGPRPDLRSLPAFGIELNRKSTHLRFSATVWNAGDSPLVVDGFRRGRGDVMDAYQYFFDPEGEQVGHQLVGEMLFHGANHQHWHFQDFARYRLLRADGSQAATSGKVSFCLANTDAIDYTVPGADWQPEGTDLSTACGDPGSLAIREVLASGSGDTYAQFRAGQAFRIEDLPNGWYWIAVEANPSGRLVEHDTTDNVSLRRLHLGGRPGARTIKVPPVGLVHEEPTGP